MYIRVFYHLLLLELNILLFDLDAKHIKVSIYKTTQIDSNDLKSSSLIKVLVDIERAASYMHFKMKKSHCFLLLTLETVCFIYIKLSSLLSEMWLHNHL